MPRTKDFSGDESADSRREPSMLDVTGCAGTGPGSVRLSAKNLPKPEPRRRFGPGAVHKELVAALVRDHGARVERFADAVRRLWRGVEELDVDGKTSVDWFFLSPNRGGSGFRRIPDAYKIDQDNQIVTIYEVVHHSPPDANKLDDFYDLFFVLDESHWTLDVVAVHEGPMLERIDYIGRTINRRRWRDGMRPLTQEERASFGATLGSRDPMFDLGAP